MILPRSILFALWFYLGTFLTVFLGLPVLRLGEKRVMRYAQRWAARMLGGLRRICGIRWEMTGRENIPAEGPALLASMHQSAFDTLIWIAEAPRFTYVFKRELARIPIFGRYLAASGMIPVDREAGSKAMRGLLRATDRAVAENRQMIIFPEGTRVAPGERAPLMPGVAAMASRSGLPVIPVVTDFRPALGTARLPQAARRDSHRRTAAAAGGPTARGTAGAARGDLRRRPEISREACG